MSAYAHAQLILGFPVTDEDFYHETSRRMTCLKHEADPGAGTFCQHCGRRLSLQVKGDATPRFQQYLDQQGLSTLQAIEWRSAFQNIPFYLRGHLGIPIAIISTFNDPEVYATLALSQLPSITDRVKALQQQLVTETRPLSLVIGADHS